MFANTSKLMTALFLLILVNSAWAIPPIDKPAAERAPLATDKMMSELEIDEALRDNLASINLKYAEQVDVVINSDMGRFKKGRQLRKIFTQKDAELEQLLTEEQYEEYLTLRDEIKKEMHAKK